MKLKKLKLKINKIAKMFKSTGVTKVIKNC